MTTLISFVSMRRFSGQFSEQARQYPNSSHTSQKRTAKIAKKTRKGRKESKTDITKLHLRIGDLRNGHYLSYPSRYRGEVGAEFQIVDRQLPRQTIKAFKRRTPRKREMQGATRRQRQHALGVIGGAHLSHG